MHARQDPKKAVPQSRRAFVADGVEQHVPEALVAGQQPRLRLVGPWFVEGDRDSNQGGVSDEDRQLHPLLESRSTRLPALLPEILFIDKERARALRLEGGLRPRHWVGAEDSVAWAESVHDTHFRRRITPIGVARECADTFSLW